MTARAACKPLHRGGEIVMGRAARRVVEQPAADVVARHLLTELHRRRRARRAASGSWRRNRYLSPPSPDGQGMRDGSPPRTKVPRPVSPFTRPSSKASR